MGDVVSLDEYRMRRERALYAPVVSESSFWSTLDEAASGSIEPSTFRLTAVRMLGLPVITDSSLPRGSTPRIVSRWE